MAGNTVLFKGRLGQDADVRELDNGQWMAAFSVCHSESYKDANDEWKQNLTWARVSWFSGRVERVADQLVKGREVFVEGKLRQNNWETEEGEKRSNLEIRVDRFSGDVTVLGMPTGGNAEGDDEEEEPAPKRKTTTRTKAKASYEDVEPEPKTRGGKMPWQNKKST